jgi:ABC-type glycerol-3-phosphate transport system permease component
MNKREFMTLLGGAPAAWPLAAAPPLVVYAFLMDYYIAGLTAGATKG